MLVRCVLKQIVLFSLRAFPSSRLCDESHFPCREQFHIVELVPFKDAGPGGFGNPLTTAEESAESERLGDAEDGFIPVSRECRGRFARNSCVDQFEFRS